MGCYVLIVSHVFGGARFLLYSYSDVFVPQLSPIIVSRMVQTKLLQPRGGVAVADALLYKHELDIDLPIWFADDRTLELSDPFELGSDRFFPDSSQGKSRSGSDSLRNVAKQVKVKSQKVAKGGRDAKKVNSSSSAGGSDGSNGTAVHTGTAPHTTRRKKHHNPWTAEETRALIEGVGICGGGKWADIKKLGIKAIERRSAVDLKDKWRNLLRVAFLPQQTLRQIERKREVSSEMLARVRVLSTKYKPKKGGAKQ